MAHTRSTCICTDPTHSDNHPQIYLCPSITSLVYEYNLSYRPISLCIDPTYSNLPKIYLCPFCLPAPPPHVSMHTHTELKRNLPYIDTTPTKFNVSICTNMSVHNLFVYKSPLSLYCTSTIFLDIPTITSTWTLHSKLVKLQTYNNILRLVESTADWLYNSSFYFKSWTRWWKALLSFLTHLYSYLPMNIISNIPLPKQTPCMTIPLTFVSNLYPTLLL